MGNEGQTPNYRAVIGCLSLISPRKGKKTKEVRINAEAV